MIRKLGSIAIGCCISVVLLLGACKGKQAGNSGDSNTAVDSTQQQNQGDESYPKEVTLKAARPQLITKDKFKWFARDCDTLYKGIAQKLGNELLKQDNSKLTALINAKKLVATYLKKVTAEQADSLYPVYFAYAGIFLGSVSDDIYYGQIPGDFYSSYDDFDKLPMAYQPIMDELRSCDMRLLDVGEGMATIDFNADYFYELFKPYATKATTEYLRINAYEQGNLFCFDAGISITWEELADRIIPFENYLKQFPDSPYKDAMENTYKSYLNMLMMGLDNTPTFDTDGDGENRALMPEVWDAYQAIIKKYSGSKLAEILRAYCMLLKKEQMKYGEEVEAFINKYTAIDDYEG